MRATCSFGRTEEIKKLKALLIQRRFVAVIGTSGCGKSSLVEAGLLPDLIADGISNDRTWRIITLRPLGTPIAELAEALADFARAEQPTALGGLHQSTLSSRFRAMLRQTTNGLREAIEEIVVDRESPVLVVIDQFEELFRYEPDKGDDNLPLFRDEAQTFTNLLLQAVQQPSTSIHVLITMRSDFFGECGRYRGLAEAVSTSQFLVPRMIREQLQMAITGPLCVAASIPSNRWPEVLEPSLLQRLLNAVGDETNADPLPLMQHALMRAWQEAELRPRASANSAPRLQVTDYLAVGEISSALSRHADEVLHLATETTGNSLPPDSIPHLFRALTDIDREGRAIRRPQVLADLAPVVGGTAANIRPVIDAFRAIGVSFLTPYSPTEITESTPIDISHEALIRRWGQIADQTVDATTGEPRGWLQQEFRDGLIWRALAVQAEAFSRNSEACLDPATTDQRYPWFRSLRRRPAWALRYMVHPERKGAPTEEPEWRRIENLLLASLRRKRDERRLQRMATRDANLRASAAIRERNRALMGVTALAALLIIAVGSSLYAYESRNEARHSQKMAEERRKQADDILSRAQTIIAATQYKMEGESPHEAFMIFQAGAENGDPTAMRNLGVTYRDGWGVGQDFAKAREWFEKATKEGNALAMTDLGLLYESGQGVAQDYAKARDWYEKGAANDVTDAMCNLGVLYENGRGVTQDYTKARDWYEKAAAEDNASAMIDLGVLYENGRGLAQDYAKARDWYEKAAAEDNASAMIDLGVLYENGRGVAQDYAKARDWYEQAAAKDDTNAMLDLGMLYENGFGMPQDDAKARKWFAFALRLAESQAAKTEVMETEQEGRPGKQTARALNPVAWYALFTREFDKALIASDRAHALLPEDLYIDTNRAHSLMFLQRGEEATAIYLANRGKVTSEAAARRWEQVIAEDLVQLRKAGLTSPLMSDIERELGITSVGAQR
jgi:TPR repeat protein